MFDSLLQENAPFHRALQQHLFIIVLIPTKYPIVTKKKMWRKISCMFQQYSSYKLLARSRFVLSFGFGMMWKIVPLI